MMQMSNPLRKTPALPPKAIPEQATNQPFEPEQARGQAPLPHDPNPPAVAIPAENIVHPSAEQQDAEQEDANDAGLEANDEAITEPVVPSQEATSLNAHPLNERPPSIVKAAAPIEKIVGVPSVPRNGNRCAIAKRCAQGVPPA